MKNLLNWSLVFLILSILSFVSIKSQFYKVIDQNSKTTKAYIFSCCRNSKDLQGPWSFFHRIIFELPLFLKKIKIENIPFVLVIPRKINGFSPLEDNAPYIEGIRTALAWTSVYFRFYNIDVRIASVIDYTIDNDLLENIVYNSLLLKYNVQSLTTPEHKFEKRIIDTSKFVAIHNNKSLKLFKVSLNSDSISTKKITLSSLPLLQFDKKRYLLTGVTGFIGSHLARKLLAEGNQVIGIDNLSCSTGENIRDILDNKNFIFVKHDVSLPFEIEEPIDSIVHLASIPSPEFYYNLPEQTLTSGLNGTKNTLDIAVNKNAQYVITSTSEVYGDPEISPQPEWYQGNVNPYGKRSQYDQSKRGAETLIKLYYDRFNLDVRIARIFNTYGPGMSLYDGRVVTNFIQAILHNESMKIYGSGEQTRSFAYIDDTIDGLYKLITINNLGNKLEDRVFNIGNDSEFTIQELANQINILAYKYFQRTSPISLVQQIDPTDPKKRKPDLSRSNSILNFKSSINLLDGLERTLLFFKEKIA